MFAPYLPIAITELVKLRSEADTIEIKSRISTTLNVTITQAGKRVRIQYAACLNATDTVEDRSSYGYYHTSSTAIVYVSFCSKNTLLIPFPLRD